MAVGRTLARPVARRSRVATAGLAAAALSVIGVLASLVAPAGRVVAETTIDAELGVNGLAEPADHVVVRIRVTADELIDGQVEVTRDARSLVVRQPLQVPAGTTKEVLLVLPGGVFTDRVRVDVRDGDRLVATTDLRSRVDAEVELVGVLPRLSARVGDLPGQVALPGDTGRAELAVIPVDVLDLGPVALEAYDTIIGTGDDLVAVSDDQRQALLLWVETGGRLVLDDVAGLDALPESWRPGAAGYAWAGRGEVRLVDGAASDGAWSDIIEPSGSSAEYLALGAEMFADPQQELAERAGVRLPSLSPLIIALAVYGLVVGPVVYLVLRRARRLTLGWVVIPVVAVLTAGGIVIAGGRFRSGGHPATATFVETSPAGALALTNTLSFSRAGGDQRIDTDPGWFVDESMAMWGGVNTSATFTMDGDGSGYVETPLESGQVVTHAFVGPAAAEDLAITATMTAEGTIAGSVTNDTDLVVHDVAVFVGNDVVPVGSLEPGAAATWTADAPRSIDTSSSRADRAWAVPFGGPRGAPASPADEQFAEVGIWGLASLKWELFPTGLARVVGWTDLLPGPVDPGADTSNRTAISATAPVDPAGRPPEPATVRTAVVRSPFGPFGDGRGTAMVYRYLLAPGAAPGALTVDGIARNTFNTLSFWDGTTWLEAALDGDAVAVPAAAVRGGTVLMRGEITGMGDQSAVPTIGSSS